MLTLWRGDIHLTVPMLFALGFIVTFVNGGLTGLFLGNVVVDVPLSDTMFVVAHFHMVMGVAPIMVVFGAIYHWYPKVTGRMLNDLLGKFHFWVTFVGAYAIFFPMHYLGLMGVPRRYFEWGDAAFIPASAHTLNAFISVVALVVGSAQLVFLFNLIWSLVRGRAGWRESHGGRRRWNGRHRRRRRLTAIGAGSCRSFTAGRMTTACLARARLHPPEPAAGPAITGMRRRAHDRRRPVP